MVVDCACHKNMDQVTWMKFEWNSYKAINPQWQITDLYTVHFIWSTFGSCILENTQFLLILSFIKEKLPVLKWLCWLFRTLTKALSRISLSINALHTCVYIYIRELSSFRAPTLWFIDLTVVTCHIQYTFPSLYPFVCTRQQTKHKHIPSPPSTNGY